MICLFSLIFPLTIYKIIKIKINKIKTSLSVELTLVLKNYSVIRVYYIRSVILTNSNWITHFEHEHYKNIVDSKYWCVTFYSFHVRLIFIDVNITFFVNILQCYQQKLYEKNQHVSMFQIRLNFQPSFIT